MARRSSARLASRSSTPKRVSLSHDAPTHRTPKTVPAKLASLDESDEMPGAFPQSASPSSRPAKMNKTGAKTPTNATPIKPSEEEMHPQLHHQTTAKPRDEARHLGFSNMAPHTEPPKNTSKIATLQRTPSRTRDLESDVKSPSFQFTFHREHSLELSPEAKKLMQEKREEAAKIREQMIADGEGMPSIDELMSARKIAKPKGRFSQVHMKEFEKMDSIAAHPSAFRLKQAGPPTPAKHSQKEDAAAKSLKRSPSKAGLDNPSSTPSRPSSRDTNKPLPPAPSSQLPRSTSVKDLKKAAVQDASPSKRVKRAVAEDVSATRPSSSDGEKPLPATPGKQQSGIPNLSHLTTPTQASLARAASVKSTKTKIPAPASFTPAKPAPASILKRPAQAPEHAGSPALLARSPSKASLFPKKPDAAHVTNSGSAASASPLLSRSPSKPVATRKSSDSKHEDEATFMSKTAPLLSRSPVKGQVAKKAETESSTEQGTAPSIPFLSRSPSKLPMPSISNEPQETLGKSTGKNLLGRFNLLRQSPMKSILRSPQRLYSDDPAKIAAGTHLATPPKLSTNVNKALPAVPRSGTPSAQKHVDFTSSTKARFEKAHSSTPSKTPTPSPKPDRDVDMVGLQESVSYPDLSKNADVGSPSPQKRRQTGGPGDFTFRAGDHGIVFGQSPNAPASAASSKRPSTIRMVSSDLSSAPAPASGSKKRKFEFENKTAAAAEDVDTVEEKENTPVPMIEEEEEEQRPAKRTKSSAPEPPAKKSSATAPTASSAARRTTLGVKPKGTKSVSPVKRPSARPSTISQARLNALSQPKLR